MLIPRCWRKHLRVAVMVWIDQSISSDTQTHQVDIIKGKIDYHILTKVRGIEQRGKQLLIQIMQSDSFQLPIKGLRTRV